MARFKSGPVRFPGRLTREAQLVERRQCGQVVSRPNGSGSNLNRRGYAGLGPCFHSPGFHVDTGLSHSQTGSGGVFLLPFVRKRPAPSKGNPSLRGGRSIVHKRWQKDHPESLGVSARKSSGVVQSDCSGRVPGVAVWLIF